MNNIMIIKELNNNVGMCAHAKSSIYIQYTHIYIPSGPQVSARGGVGRGMLTSCSCYVVATLMGGVGWGGAC